MANVHTMFGHVCVRKHMRVCSFLSTYTCAYLRACVCMCTMDRGQELFMLIKSQPKRVESSRMIGFGSANLVRMNFVRCKDVNQMN